MISSAARRASARTSTTFSSRSGTRDLRSFGSQGEQRLTVLALLLAEAELIAERRGFAAAAAARRRPLGARPEPPPRARRASARDRPDADHRDGGLLASGRPGTAPGGLSGRGEGGLMDRVGGDVARELGRFGPASGMAPGRRGMALWRSVRRSPATPGRRALARDGTLHVHTQDSIWAFELTTRAEEIRTRLGKAAPRRSSRSRRDLSRSPRSSRSSRSASAPPKPTAEHVAKAESLTRVIRDEELRKVVAKAAAASLSRDDNDRSFC